MGHHDVEEVALLIVAPPDDLHAHAVHDTAVRSGASVEWIDSACLATTARLRLELDRLATAVLTLDDGRRIPLAAGTTIWWRRPRLPAGIAAQGDDRRAFVASEWEHFLDAMEPFAPARWVNPPGAETAPLGRDSSSSPHGPWVCGRRAPC